LTVPVREARVDTFVDTLADSSPVQEMQESALRALLVWAGQGSNLRPWDQKLEGLVQAFPTSFPFPSILEGMQHARKEKAPRLLGFHEMGGDGLEPPTSCV
jgi:hypothetical protein